MVDALAMIIVIRTAVRIIVRTKTVDGRKVL